MTLSVEAIQHIEAQQAAEKINQEMKLSGIPLIALPTNVGTKNIEEFMSSPQHFKGTFATLNIGEFTTYCNDNHGATTFVNQEKMQATAIFDFGDGDTPMHQFHKAELLLKKNPEFTKMLQIDGQTLSQKGFIELLEDYHANIQVLGKESIPGETPPSINLVSAIKAVRDTKVKSTAEVSNKIEDFSESQSTFAKQEVNNAGHNPVYIDWTCEPYQGLRLPMQSTSQNDGLNHSRTFRLRVNTLTNGEKVGFTLRVIKLEEHQQIMAEAFRDQLTHDLNNQSVVRIGTWSK
nr:hypothetical protein 10 [Piscirickettsiaceae bacterium]